MVEIVATAALWWLANFFFGFVVGQRLASFKPLILGWGFYIPGLILYLHLLSVGSLEFRLIPPSGEVAGTIGAVIAYLGSSFGLGYYIGRKKQCKK